MGMLPRPLPYPFSPDDSGNAAGADVSENLEVPCPHVCASSLWSLGLSPWVYNGPWAVYGPGAAKSRS